VVEKNGAKKGQISETEKSLKYRGIQVAGEK
jgi:hypothetical protein